MVESLQVNQRDKVVKFLSGLAVIASFIFLSACSGIQGSQTDFNNAVNYYNSDTTLTMTGINYSSRQAIYYKQSTIAPYANMLQVWIYVLESGLLEKDVIFIHCDLKSLSVYQREIYKKYGFGGAANLFLIPGQDDFPNFWYPDPSSAQYKLMEDVCNYK